MDAYGGLGIRLHCLSHAVFPPTEPVPVLPVSNPYAVERPHAPVGMFERQGSVRLQGRLSEASPFKRQYSLRLNELPSTLERQGRLPTRENTPRGEDAGERAAR